MLIVEKLTSRKQVIGLVVLVFLVAILSSGCIRDKASTDSPQVCIRGVCLSVDIADSRSERQTGLMYRESMPLGHGMLFAFENEGSHGFYMKNTLIPLDIIWIGADKKIVFIASNTIPLDETVIMPDAPAQWVLEVNAGVASANHFQVGDRVEI